MSDERDDFTEACAIARGQSRLLPEQRHLLALVKRCDQLTDVLVAIRDIEAATAKKTTPDWAGADRRSGNGVEHAARDERRGPEVKR